MTKQLTKYALIAALYVAVSLAIAPLAFGPIQFRIGEALMILPFYDKRFSFSLILGCFIVNIFSELGAIDMVVGTFATALCCLIICKLNTKTLIPLVAAVVNGVIVGLELNYVFQLPLLFTIFTVFLGEFSVLIVGVILFKQLEKNPVISGYLRYVR